MIVVTLLSIVAVSVLQSARPVQHQALKLAADEVANAFLYARAEAIRTGELHGVYVDYRTDYINVFKFDSALPPATADIIYHPVNKTPYEYDLRHNTFFKNTDISNRSAPFRYSGTSGRKASVLFNEMGQPVYMKSGSEQLALRYDTSVELTLDQAVKSILLNTAGQVNVQ